MFIKCFILNNFRGFEFAFSLSIIASFKILKLISTQIIVIFK